MDLFLGIDGGGTGCRAVLADASGHILGRGEAGPANIASDFPGALDNILTATRAACGVHDLTALSAGLGLAGANAAGMSDRLAHALPFARMAIETDAITAVRGALGATDGIVAAIGTGSVFAAQRGGQMRQIGGWGLVLGDEAFAVLSGNAKDKLVQQAIAMDTVVRDAVAENSLNPQNIEAAIRKGLLPLLFSSLGLDNAKLVVEQVIQITRVGLSKS